MITLSTSSARGAAGLLVSLACTWSAAQSLPTFKPSSDRGFSYFLGVAQQTAAYSERPSADVLGIRVITSNKTKSAMLVSGALYAFNDDLLLSLDNHSTFAPAVSMERWREVDGPLLQTNRFSLSQSHTRVMAYVRQQRDVFLTGGVSFRSQSFKRYDFRAQDSRVDTSQNVPTEESSSELVGEIGLALEGERVKQSANHYGVRVTVGTPLWRQVTNTSYPSLTFNDRGGWDANVEARYSWALSDIAHLGLWGKYSFSVRKSQRQGYINADTGVARTAELPDSHLRTTTVGVELLWKL